MEFNFCSPQPYPVEVVKHVPVQVPVDRPYPVFKHIHVDRPVPVDRPVAV